MLGWSDVERAFGGLFDFARVRSSRLTSGNSVLATLRGTEGSEGNEEAPDCEVWGVAGLQSRPKAPTASGGQTRSAEVLILRPGDELVGVASRDLRFQVSVIEGEVAVHALGRDGATQAVIRLQPSGVVKIEATQVLLDASSFVRVEPGGFSAAIWEKVRDAFNAHTHASAGAPPDAASIATMATAGSSKLGVPT
ncbi:MAG: hypothetical protein IT379_39395 [Deltaproteobacteria bacterium]|nr:hypothetical protein [Deltaproteobacteria bacterium]